VKLLTDDGDGGDVLLCEGHTTSRSHK